MTPPVRVADVVDLARLAMDFAAVDRATFWPDGATPESDTDHTMMLALVACSYAERVNVLRGRRAVKERFDNGTRDTGDEPRLLDLGLVAQFAVVHDLVEAVCGDVDTKDITPRGRADKAAREHEALEVIRARFAALPWVANTIDRYERLEEPEARFVKVLDKVLPKITNVLSSCVVLRREGRTVEKLRTFNGSQRQALAERFPDQVEALALLNAAHDELVAALEAPAP